MPLDARSTRPTCSSPLAPAGRRRRGARRDLGVGHAQPPLHLRPVRHRRVQPVRPRRRALGRREPGPVLQPAVHLRAAGLGKTHLLHAIGHHVRAVFRNKRVRYVSTETFMNEFVDAIRAKAMPGFKRRYRELDVLLIDDIQFLERTQELQEEFFHTFNQLHSEGGQIVISSDRPPEVDRHASRTGCAAGSSGA